MDRAILQDLLEPIVIMTRSWRSIVCRVAGVSALLGIGLTPGVRLRAETGSELWLRYPPLTDAIQRTSYRQCVTAIVVQGRSPTSDAIAAELGRGFRGLLGADIPRVDRPRSDGAVIVGTPSTSPLIAALGWTDALARLGDEGYLLRSTKAGGRTATVIAAAESLGQSRRQHRTRVRGPLAVVAGP